jgi:hypothetical protein
LIEKPRITALAVVAFLIGAFGWVRGTFVGLIYLEEVFLLAVAVALIFTRGRRLLFSDPLFHKFLGAFAITMIGYVLSDLVRGSTPENYLRGWGRLFLSVTSFVGLALLAANDRQTFWWFAAGRGIGGALSLKFIEHLPVFGYWKYAVDETMAIRFSSFGYAEYVGGTLAVAAVFLPRHLAALAFLALGAFSFHLDFRYHALICMSIAGLLYLRILTRNRPIRKLPIGRILIVGIVAIIAVKVGYELSETPGAAGRREISDRARYVGLQVGVRALLASPIVGYGSWGRSPEIAAIEESVARESGLPPDYRISGSAAVTHSEIFQSMLEGGMLGAAFFVFLAYALLRAIRPLCFSRPFDALLPVLLYWYLYAFWEVINAPLGANSRMHIGQAVAALLIVSMEQRLRLGGRTGEAVVQVAPPPETRRRGARG